MDIGASNWNEADAANSTAAPDGAPEGMAPSGVNDTIRAIMGASKRWYVWSSPRTTGGTATAYTLAYAVAPGALVDGQSFVVQFHAANGQAATLDINSLGARPLHYHAAGAWRVAPPGLLDTEDVLRVAYHDGTGAFRLVGMRNGTGRIEAFAGAAPPVGALLCNGAAISRTDYAGLFAVCGTAFGAGDSTTTFNLPDLRGRVPAGLDGGTARLPGFGALGAAGGAATESASISGTASGTVSGFTGALNSTTNVQGGTQDTVVASNSHVHTVNIGAVFTLSGSTAAANNVQPTIAVNYIIRT